MNYVTKIVVPQTLPLDGAESFIEAIRAVAGARVLTKGSDVPREVEALFEIEEGKDLYDLAEAVLDLQVELSSIAGEYIEVSRPTPIEGGT